MPIKELMTWSAGILATLFVLNGPLHFRSAVHQLQWKILHEIGRTDDWGDPSLAFHYKTPRYLRGTTLRRHQPGLLRK